MLRRRSRERPEVSGSQLAGEGLPTPPKCVRKTHAERVQILVLDDCGKYFALWLS